MKRSESDGTDLKIFKNIFSTLLFICAYIAPASAAELHLYSTKDSQVLNGVLINGQTSLSVSGIIENGFFEGIILNQTTDSVNDGTSGLDSVNDGTGGLDSVNDGTGGLDSVNDGTGGLDSVNDGTGGLDSVNDGTGGVNSVNDGTGGLDSVNDGTGGLDYLQNGVVVLDFVNCKHLSIETSKNTYEMNLSTIKIDNEGLVCN